MAPERMRHTQHAHRWAEARTADLEAIRANVPPHLLNVDPPSSPLLVDGAYVGITTRETQPQWAQVEHGADGETVLHELWLDLSRKPHRTGRTLSSLNKQVLEASVWIHRRERYSEKPHDGPDEVDEEDDPTPPEIAIAGLRSSHYPTDAGWYLDGSQPHRRNGTPHRLSDLTIREFTRISTERLTTDVHPNCEAAWNERIGRELPWKKIWESLGTELSDATEESRWFKNLHRATFVRNRKDVDDQSCRLKCGEIENMLHLTSCDVIRRHWDNIFDFLKSIGEPKPANQVEAILFNLWSQDDLGSTTARAVIRHAFSEMYRRFALVDTDGHIFTPSEASIATLEALRRALIRRAKKIQKLHANRFYTNKPDGIPAEDAARYPTLITMDSKGNYTLSSIIDDTIAALKLKAIAERDQTKKRRRKKQKRA